MKNNFVIDGDITTIYLKRKDGTYLETFIDTASLEKANEYEGTWYASWCQDVGSYYVLGHAKSDCGRDTNISLHRWITNAPKELQVDHINHNTLDNRSSNLRKILKQHNMQNYKGARRNSKSGIRGVSKRKDCARWKAQIQVEGKTIYLGQFEDIRDAEKAVIEARRLYMPYSIEVS